MLSSEEKLRQFSEAVYRDAQNQCDVRIAEAKQKANAETEAYETECLEAAYQTIQKEKAKIVSAANERLSKAKIDAKRALLLRREEITKEVFAEVSNKIAAYKQTEEYKNDLMDAVKKAKESDGGNGVTVYLALSDAQFADEIKNRYGVEVHVSDTDDLIGGIRVQPANTNKIFDMSYATRLREAGEEFLEFGGLTL